MSVPNPTQQAAAAIVALINSSPRSPRQDEIEAILARIGHAPAQDVPISDLRIRLRKAIAKSNAALDVLARLPDGAEFHLAEAERAMWEDEIAAIEKEIPTRRGPSKTSWPVPRSRVTAATSWMASLIEAENDEDVFEGPAARLIEAVLHFAKEVQP